MRANDCVDDTFTVLRRWLDSYGGAYKSVTEDYSDIGGLSHYANHQWDAHRFAILGRLRQESVDHARRLGAHYFVSDLDNFVVPETLQNLCEAGLPVVAPLLRAVYSQYSNYFPLADPDGYAIIDAPGYHEILNGVVRGFIMVDVVHCTYFVRADVLDEVTYDDGSGRFEYAIFSDTLRRKGIPQYVDNRRIYGLVGFLGGDSADYWGRFDHPDFMRRIVNLANEKMSIVNNGGAF